MTTPRRLALIAVLAFIPILPYVFLGYAGQDLPFHVCSWLELKAGWLNGQVHPGWSAAANFGRGDPHLTFYPPVSYYLGALLTLILPLKLAPAAFAWLALSLGGVSMYAASKPFVADRDRLTAATLYLLGPYLITTSLVRFAAAELLVQAWLPLIALYFYQAIWTPAEPASGADPTSRRAFFRLALLLGLSWVTNIPASIVLLYNFATASILCAILQRSLRPLLRIFLAEAIAAAIAAFHLLPAWKEQHWIHSGTLLRVDPRQFLLFMPHANFDDGPLLVACWIFLCTQALLAIACLRRRTLPLSAEPALPLLACLAAVSFILQSPVAIPLWQHAPELRFVQFPLRFLAIIGVAFPLLLLSRGTRPSLRRPAYILTAALSLMPFIAYLSEQAVAANRKPPLPSLLADWQHKGAPEYLPAGTLTPLGPANLADLASVDPLNPFAPDNACQLDSGRRSPDLRTFKTRSSGPCRVRLTTYFYPYWHATDESNHSLTVTRDPTGFLLVDVPPGAHTVVLAFHPASRIRTVSALVSLATLILLAGVILVSLPLRDRPSRP